MPLSVTERDDGQPGDTPGCKIVDCGEVRPTVITHTAAGGSRGFRGLVRAVKGPNPPSPVTSRDQKKQKKQKGASAVRIV